MDNVTRIASLLYGNLLSACPIDTGNMKSNITIDRIENGYKITISNGVDYARYVNYNWGNRTKASQKSYTQRRKNRPQKEKANYLWVERTINQTLKSAIGGNAYVV